jgi:hypothetical protein
MAEHSREDPTPNLPGDNPTNIGRKTVKEKFKRDVQVIRYQSGARKPMAGESPGPQPIHTSERGHVPKRPYGLTESLEDKGDAERLQDGLQRKETAAQFARSNAGRHNNGISSAEPRVISGDESGDATFPLKQDARKK